jgi:twitching motility protein PilT
VDGAIVDSTDAVLSDEDVRRLAFSVLDEAQRRRFEAENELDVAFAVQGMARFRANFYRQRGSVALAVRRIPLEVARLDTLGLPPIVASLAERPRGLVLVTGPTGSGKSTTLAAMVDRINRERSGHILTVEDPIEFVHRDQRCIVTQREVGADTGSFARALKYALRQDPDVILVGEMRDVETIRAALTIAETGHLCLATLHTNSTVETVNRIIDVFPADQQPQVRAQLAFVLEGVVTQALLPRAVGPGRVCAAEVMICTPAIRACIRENKLHQLYSNLQMGKKYGMQTLNDALFDLFVRREVALEDCLRASGDPTELQRMATGPAQG